MTKTIAQSLGQKGENRAAEFLRKTGHNILETNWRSGKSELDIISHWDNVLVISEVKSFQSKPLGAVEYRVNKSKQKQIMQGVYAYLGEHPEFENKNVRLDVIVVDFSVYPANIRQYQGAFYDDGSFFY